MRSFLERGKEKGGGWLGLWQTVPQMASHAKNPNSNSNHRCSNYNNVANVCLQSHWKNFWNAAKKKKRQKLDYVGGGDGDLEWLQVIKYTAQQDKHRKDNTQTAKNPSPVSPENVRVPFPGSPELQSHFWHMSPHNHICNYRTRGRQAVTLKTF